MSGYVHASNKTKNILALGKDYTQGLNSTTLYAETLYSINFTKTNKKFCLSLHYNGASSYLFLNDTEIRQFKTKDSEIVSTPLCIGNIFKDVFVDNMKKKTGLS